MQSFMAGSRLGYGLLAKLANGIRPTTDLSKRGADLSRGPLASSKLPAAAWSNTWPAPASTLDLDFANNRGFVRGSGQGGAMDAVTFTRASSGNWVDNTGTLRTGAGTFTGTANALGVNLLAVTQNFENATWVKTSNGGTDPTIIANSVVAPDGTLTACTYSQGATPNLSRIYQVASVTANATLTQTYRVKKNVGTWIRLVLTDTGNSNGVHAWFNLETGVKGSSGAFGAGATFVSSAMSADSNGFYLVTLTGIVGNYSSINAAWLQISDADSSTTRLANSSCYIWGAQLEVGSSATTYYPTNINAPRFDWASTTVTPNVNLLQATEQFDNAYWSVVVAAVSANTTATTDPLGTNTADLIYPTGTGFNRAIQRGSSVLSLNIKTISVYAKAAGFSWLSIRDNTTAWAFFNLSTGTLGTVTSGYTASITSVGNGWYRCVATSTGAAVTFPTFMLSDADNSSFTTASGTNGFYLWGAQGETGSSATAYQSIGAQSPTNTPLVANSTCNGLLVEESRTNRILWCRDGLNGGTAVGTNLVPYSEQFDNAAWNNTLNVSVTANQTTAPDSTNTADLIASNATNGQHYMFKSAASSTVTVTSGVTYNASFYLKKGSGATAPDIVQMAFTSVQFPSGYANFNINTGTVGTVSNVTASITNIGSGWYRCSIVATATGSSAGSSVFGLAFTNNNDGLGRLPSYADATTSDVFIWGAQLLPLGLLTDYQVTAASAVTNVWSKSNVTVAKTATGIDGVANAATTITASANNAVLIQPINLASGSRTGSVYLKRITGTGNVQVTLDGSTWSTVDLSNGLWNRVVLSGTVTNPCVGVLLATNGDAVAMDYAQVEDNTTTGGTLATSPILTTSATATRAGDFASMSGANFFSWFSYTPMTLYAEATPYCSGTQTAIIFGTNTASSNNANWITKSDNAGSIGSLWTGIQNAVGSYTISNGLPQATVLSKSRIAFSNSVFYGAFAANGVIGNTTSAPFRPEFAPSTVAWFGGRDNGLQFNGAIGRAVFFRGRSNQSQLQSQTSAT